MIPNAAIGNTQIAINLNPKNLIFFSLFVFSCLSGGEIVYSSLTFSLASLSFY